MADTPSKSRRRFLRFSLRATLLLAVAIGVSLGSLGRKAKEQRIALLALETMGCSIAYRDAADPGLPNALERCRKLLGEEPWIDVGYLFGGNEQLDDAGLAHLRGLPRLRSLSLDGSSVTDTRLVNLRYLPMLSELNLAHTRVTDAGLVYLRGCAQLQELDLSGTQVTDAGLAHLHGLRQLKTRWLNPTAVTEDGVQELQKAMPTLKILSWW